ncbi:MAG: hypothetical protein WD802_12610 [Gemmatimonadaceae bacterium]
MTRKPWLAATGLSLYLCVVLWIQRTGGSPLHTLDLIGSCSITILAVWVGWLVSGRRTKDPDRRGLIALVFGFWGLLFSTFQVLSEDFLGSWFQSQLFAAASWTALCVTVCWIILRGSSSLAFVTRALGIASIILLAGQSVQAMAGLRSEPAAQKVTDRRDGKSPDVFLIVLDKYSSGAWLSHTYGVDHKPFEDSLRALGFVVPTAARANYAHTQLALASFLNWRLFETPEAGQPALSWNGTLQLIGAARTWDAFHRKGYRVVHFPSTFPATRTLASADAELRPNPRQVGGFGETWRMNSALASWTPTDCARASGQKGGATPYPVETLDDIEWKLEAIQSLRDSAGPVVVFMHLLIPHEPYLFDSNCARREPWWPLTDQGADFDRIRSAYAIQVTCLDRMLLRTIRGLLKRPGIRPVIILQGDHGHGRITVNPLRGFTLTAQELSIEQLGERFGIFAAYLFPGADTAVYNDISPVNVMPLVLQSIFGTVVPPQSDRSFWSTYQNAFTFSEVAPELTRPPVIKGGNGSAKTSVSR